MIPSSRLVAATFGLFVCVAAARAAGIPKPPPEVSRTQNDVFKMRSGSIRVLDPDDKAQKAKNLAEIKTMAEWLAYTIATPPYNGEPVPREDKTPAYIKRQMSDLMSKAESFANLPISAGNMGKVSPEQVEYGEEFGAAIALTTHVVLENSARPIERVNAVRLMSICAKLPAPKLADPFIEIINNPKISDGEKLYAFQGLKNLLEQSDPTFTDRHIFRDVVLLGKIATALTNYITLKRDVRNEREQHVIEFVRRYAVAALAAFKSGALRKPNRDLVARPSWTLARVLESDPTVYPLFTIQEQIEAGVGFCQMKIDPDMNLDVGAYSMAKLMVIFARAANDDFERATTDGALPAVPWKIAAARLSYALAVWREAAKALPKTRNPDTVITLANTGIALLALIEEKGGAANTARDIAAVTTWAQNNQPKAWAESPPKNAQLYQDDPNSVLPFAAVAPPKKGGDPKLTTPAVDPKKNPVPPKK